MALITMGRASGPAVLGIASAVFDKLQDQQRGRTDNIIARNLGLAGDLALGGFAIANQAGMLGRTQFSQTADEMAAAGVALITKRLSQWGIEQTNILNGARHAPSRRMSLRSPGSAVETSVLPRKRQFFSVV
jgi:hypothetical protein